MKKTYVKPEANIENFVPNEYVAMCGQFEDGSWVFWDKGAVRMETAWHRKDGGIKDSWADDILFDPHPIFMGSFYRLDENGEKIVYNPDSTAQGHEETIAYDVYRKCVRETDKQPWSFHYEFVKYNNHS